MIDKGCPDCLRSVPANWLFHTVHNASQFHHRGKRDLAESHTTVFLVLGLQLPCKILVTLICHHIELIHRVVKNPQAILIDG